MGKPSPLGGKPMSEQDELWKLLNEFLASAFRFGAKFDENNQEPQEAIDVVASVTTKLVAKVKQHYEQPTAEQVERAIEEGFKKYVLPSWKEWNKEIYRRGV